MEFLNIENRSIGRTSLPLPVRVEVAENSAESWNESTTMRDVSALGGGFRLERALKRGRIVMLSMPLPTQLRRYDLHDELYNVWAIVRRCVKISMPRRDPYYIVGAAFIGKFPPTGHLQSPKDLFDLALEQPANDGFWRITPNSYSNKSVYALANIRKHSRLNIPEPFLLEATGPDGRIIASEFTVTENISAGGASMFTALNVEPGQLLRATCRRTNDTIIAIVRGKAVGSDGLTRLHLEFVDKPFPMDGLI